MNTITIPKKIVRQGELVVLPRKEYEKLLHFWLQAERISSRERSEITKGIREIDSGKFFTLKNAKRELGLSSRS